MRRRSRNPESPKLLYPSGLVQVCTGIAFLVVRIDDFMDIINVRKNIGHMAGIEVL
jgi:hypothetical protein